MSAEQPNLPRCLEGMVASGKFPEPVRIGKRNVWGEKVITCWQDTPCLSQKNWHPSD